MKDILHLDEHGFLLFSCGIIALLAATVPTLLRKKYLSAPIVYLILGIILYFSWIDFGLDITEHTTAIKHITEFVILVALANAGIRIREPFAWKTWKYAFRLLAFTMPLTIIASAFSTYWILGFAPATAILFGALISPTDPVLASELQTSDPGEPDRSKTKLGLTAEAGINDGVAFPFVWLAIYMQTEQIPYQDWIGEWFVVEFLYKIGIGVIIGLIGGYLLIRLVFAITNRKDAAYKEISRGILSLTLLLLPYAVAEFFNGYGFLAVFFAACMFSNSEKNLHHATSLHDFNEELESFVVVLIFIVTGFFIASKYELMFEWRILLIAAIMIFVIRPVAGYFSLAGTGLNKFQKFVMSFYGIRGIGSIYYLTFAMGAASFAQKDELIAVTTATIFMSVVLHGASARFVQKRMRQHDYDPNKK